MLIPSQIENLKEYKVIYYTKTTNGVSLYNSDMVLVAWIPMEDMGEAITLTKAIPMIKF